MNYKATPIEKVNIENLDQNWPYHLFAKDGTPMQMIPPLFKQYPQIAKILLPIPSVTEAIDRLWDEGSVFITHSSGHRQFVMNEGTFKEILKAFPSQSAPVDEQE